MKNPLVRSPSARDYTLFYDFAKGLLQETVTKPNLLSFFIQTSFDDMELLTVSISEKENIYWEYGVWDHRKDLNMYFSEHSAIDKYRYQILKPNPTIFFAKGTLPNEAYNHTLSLLDTKEYPHLMKKSQPAE